MNSQFKLKHHLQNNNKLSLNISKTLNMLFTQNTCIRNVKIEPVDQTRELDISVKTKKKLKVMQTH